MLVDRESNDLSGSSADLNSIDCDWLVCLLGHRKLQVCCSCSSAGCRCGNTFGNVGSWDLVLSVGIVSVSMTAILDGSIVWLVVCGVSCGVAMSLGRIVLPVAIRNWLRVVAVGVVRVSTDFQSKDGCSGGCGFREHFKSIRFLVIL